MTGWEVSIVFQEGGAIGAILFLLFAVVLCLFTFWLFFFSLIAKVNERTIIF
jgi:hypothetical protein